MVYFLGAHPFLDGNGRISRIILADYLTRQGYLLNIILIRAERIFETGLQCDGSGDGWSLYGGGGGGGRDDGKNNHTD